MGVARFADYNVELKEIHHIHKLDSPRALVEGILENLDRFDKWSFGESGNGLREIESIR